MFGLELEDELEWEEGRPLCDECGGLMSPFVNTLSGGSGWECDECGWHFNEGDFE